MEVTFYPGRKVQHDDNDILVLEDSSFHLVVPFDSTIQFGLVYDFLCNLIPDHADDVWQTIQNYVLESNNNKESQLSQLDPESVL